MKSEREKQVGVNDVEDLIPGLPEDVAVDCLARLPYECHHRLRLVNKSWNALFSDPSYYRRRKLAGRAETLIFVVLAVPPNCDFHPREGYYGAISIFNITYDTWARLPGTAPSYPPGIASDRCVGVGSKVVLLGGWDSHTWELKREVYVYDFIRPGEGWRRRAPMPTTRVSFAFAAVGGTVYVAGGEDPSSDEGLRSAEAYDVETDTWRQLPDMRYGRRRSLGYSICGRFVVVGKEESGEMFDPCMWEWVLPRACNRDRDDGGGEEGRIKGSLLPLSLWRMGTCTTSDDDIHEATTSGSSSVGQLGIDDDDGRLPGVGGGFERRRFAALVTPAFILSSDFVMVTGMMSIGGVDGGRTSSWDSRLLFTWHLDHLTMKWTLLDPPMDHDFPGYVGWATLVHI